MSKSKSKNKTVKENPVPTAKSEKTIEEAIEKAFRIGEARFGKGGKKYTDNPRKRVTPPRKAPPGSG